MSSGGRRATYLGVGCVTAVAGWFSGAMFAVLVAKIVGAVRGCPAAETGAPCDWYLYALAGGILGMISLPSLAVYRLRRGEQSATSSDRG